MPQRHSFHCHNEDSDPDEADIEELFNIHGFLHHRNTRVGLQQQRRDAVFGTLSNLVQNVGPHRPVGGVSDGQRQGIHPHVRPTTDTSGSAAASLTTFIRSSPHASQVGLAGLRLTRQRTFSSPPNAQEEHGPGQEYSHGLSVFLDLLRASFAVRLDVRFAREMVSSPQRNAAPPATQDTLSKLERCTVNTYFLDNCQTECPICIDKVKVGEVAAFLPCKHWFHDDCIVLWLEEHNTCPICRTPVEGASANNTARAYGVDSPRAQGTRRGNVGNHF